MIGGIGKRTLLWIVWVGGEEAEEGGKTCGNWRIVRRAKELELKFSVRDGGKTVRLLVLWRSALTKRTETPGERGVDGGK